MRTDDEIRNCTERLIDAIRDSSVYAEYAEAKEELDKYPDRRGKANSFRRDNFIARNYTGDEVSAGRADLYRRRQLLRMDPVIDRYLCAELLLCRTLQECAIKILNMADLDLEKMKDIL